jgi:hypothetical protein
VDTSVCAGSKKKAYEKPRLEVYGDLEAITQTAGDTGTSDKGSVEYHHRTQS